MSSTVRATCWQTARNLHQIQMLSCDNVALTEWTASDHCAPYWRLYWHSRAGADLVLPDRVMPVRANRIMLIPPGTHFGSRLRRPITQFFLSFIVEPAYGGPHGRVVELQPSAELLRLCRRITHTLDQNSCSLRASLLGHRLVAECLLQIPDTHWQERFEDVRVTDAVARIRQGYPRRVAVIRLARAAAMSPAAFIRLFKRCTGRTPLAYANGLRIEEACTLLHQSESSIDEIAERTGFADRSHFTRVFSSRMNCPPARYRKLVNAARRLRPPA